jgi:hypothetical protein
MPYEYSIHTVSLGQYLNSASDQQNKCMCLRVFKLTCNSNLQIKVKLQLSTVSCLDDQDNKSGKNELKF